MTMVSLYCDDDVDCVINNNDIAGGHWKIRVEWSWEGVRLADSAVDLWPHQVRSWEYYTFDGVWQSDPQLTVTGNIPKAPQKENYSCTQGKR